jgi:hypothetical protein
MAANAEFVFQCAHCPFTVHPRGDEIGFERGLERMGEHFLVRHPGLAASPLLEPAIDRSTDSLYFSVLRGHGQRLAFVVRRISLNPRRLRDHVHRFVQTGPWRWTCACGMGFSRLVDKQ